MKVDDIRRVAALARSATELGLDKDASEIGPNDKAIEAVEDWLRSVGALTATVKGAKVLDARSRAAGKAGTKRRQRTS